VSDLDFLLGSGDGDSGTATATAVAPVNELAAGVIGADGKPPPTGNAARMMQRLQKPSTAAQSDSDEAAKDVLLEIADILAPPPEDEPEARTERDEKGRFAKQTADEETAGEGDAEQTAKITAKQPIQHDARLIYMASANGIGPDEAAQYPNARALMAEINLRQIERGATGGQKGEGKKHGKDENTEDTLAPPTLEFDEDVDPKLRASVEKTLSYAQKALEREAKEKLALRNELDQIKSEHEQAASREAQHTAAKIARMFDDKVASWGEEYQELLGVPSKSYEKPGTKQHAEAVKLHEYVKRQAAGYATLTGREATFEDLEGWAEEARYAVWRDLAERGARNRVAKNLQRQKGGVGLRPTRSSRETEAPVQGDEAAKAALVNEFPELFYSWTGKRRSA
jgi:hypothetical protein